MDIFVLILASGMALYSNEQACEHDAWTIEATVNGHANYDTKRCHEATGTIDKKVVSYSVYRSGVVIGAHADMSSCNEVVTKATSQQFYEGKPASAWCSYVDRPVQMDVQK